MLENTIGRKESLKSNRVQKGGEERGTEGAEVDFQKKIENIQDEMTWLPLNKLKRDKRVIR